MSTNRIPQSIAGQPYHAVTSVVPSLWQAAPTAPLVADGVRLHMEAEGVEHPVVLVLNPDEAARLIRELKSLYHEGFPGREL